MENSKEVLLTIENLNFTYKHHIILNNIRLHFEKGRGYSIVGPNGCGKTTLLKNINKRIEPEQKSIQLFGKDISNYPIKQIAQKIGAVPQNIMIDYNFSAQEIVTMGRNPYLKRFQSINMIDKQIVKQAMMDTETWEFRNRAIHELSGGELQRVIIARTLAQDTDIILMDEPISNLDLHHQIQILELTKKLIQHKNKTVIMVLHDLNLAARYSDEIILMNRGEVTALGSPHQVITKKNIEKIYKIKVEILSHPITGAPQVIPL